MTRELEAFGSGEKPPQMGIGTSAFKWWRTQTDRQAGAGIADDRFRRFHEGVGIPAPAATRAIRITIKKGAVCANAASA